MTFFVDSSIRNEVETVSSSFQIDGLLLQNHFTRVFGCAGCEIPYVGCSLASAVPAGPEALVKRLVAFTFLIWRISSTHPLTACSRPGIDGSYCMVPLTTPLRLVPAKMFFP